MYFETALAGFALVTLLLLGGEIAFTYATQGFGFGFSSNRQAVTRSGFGLRLERTYRNQVESAAYIVPALAAGALSGIDIAALHWAALAIVVGRTAFAVLYLTGIPLLRIFGFVLGSLGAFYIVMTVLMHGA